MGKQNLAAALIYGAMPHHLDHLGILASLLDIPLIVTEESLQELALAYYPSLKVIYWDYLHVAENLVSQFETIFYSMPRILFEEVFFLAQMIRQKKIDTIWLPHGNSDKGHASCFMEALKDDKTALVYGPQMVDFLKAKNVFNHLQKHIVLGNFRYLYYKKHKSFYDALVAREFPADKKLILYAPTWKDGENSTSFYTASPLLIEKLPASYTLLIKLHPNLNDFETESLIEKYQERPNVIFIKEFTPIYPLLNRIDLYIGDMSSIGYDFLTFNRPMYFLNPNRRDPKNDPGLFLHRCGITLNPEEYETIYERIEQEGKQIELSKIRKEVYDYTFGKEVAWEGVVTACKAVLHKL